MAQRAKRRNFLGFKKRVTYHSKIVRVPGSAKEAKPSRIDASGVKEELAQALAGQGLSKSEAKRRAAASYKPGDSFDDAWRRAMKRNPGTGPQYARFFKLQKKAEAADERFQRALRAEYGARAGDMRYQTSQQTAKIRALGIEKQKADAAASAALAIARANPPRRSEAYEAGRSALRAAAAKHGTVNLTPSIAMREEWKHAWAEFMKGWNAEKKAPEPNPSYRTMQIGEVTKYAGTLRDGAVRIHRRTSAQILPLQRKYGGEIIDVIDSRGKHVAYDLIVKKAANPAKFDRCVADVQKSLKKYKRPGNAYAICTASGTRNAKRSHARKPQLRAKRKNTKTRRNYQSMIWSGKQGGASAEVYKTGKSSFEVDLIEPKGTTAKIPAKSFGGALSIARVKLHELASNPNQDAISLVPGAAYADTLVRAGSRVVKGVKRSASGLIKKVKGHKNPVDQAMKVFEEFHGMPSEEILEVTEKQHFHSVKVGIGLLVSIKVLLATSSSKAVDINSDGFEFHKSDGGYWTYDEGTPLIKRVLLSSSEDGKQLFIDGGDQAISENVLKSWGFDERDFHDAMKLGSVKEITYRTRKSFDKGEVVDYYHEFGKEGSQGVLPDLLYHPRSERLTLAGGRYYIAPPDKSLGNVSPGLVG